MAEPDVAPADGGGSLTIVIGRGHSGTRILSHTLLASGVYLGKWLNPAADKIPGDPMYEACRLIGRHVEWDGALAWDFSRLHSTPVDPEFVSLVEQYLEDVLAAKRKRKGWKLPETTLAYPWIVRMFPRARYIHLVRDPRDCLLGGHLTDDLSQWNVPCPDTDDAIEQKAASWKYQYDIVRATPAPERFTTVRYEDLVLDLDQSMRRLEGFLDMPLARVVVSDARVGKWRSDERVLPHLAPLEQAMEECGYGDSAA